MEAEMANSLSKDLEIMFGEYIEGYDAACVISKECETSYPEPAAMQRAGDVFYKPQNFNATVVTGLDVSSATKSDVIQRMVPTSYRVPDNVVFQLDAKEMRDPELLRKKGEAASIRLAAEVDKNIYSTVAAQAGIVVKKTGALAWDDGATAEALMLSRGIGAGRDRKMFLNPFDYKDIAKDLGNRAYLGDRSKDAYERSKVPDIAGFQTFRTDNVANQTVTGTVTSTLVNGAGQALTVAAMNGELPQDNRRMTLNCDGANVANVKAGDAFTLPTVNAVHQIDKSDTGQLMTFRVISNTAGALVITPAIITSGPYQNVTNAPADNAALTFLNTATKPVNAFWAQGAVSLDYGKLAFPSGQGVDVKHSTTKQGVPLIMSYAFDHLTGITTCRFTTLYAATVLDPEQCGIIIANQ
jgi:hypothetical protein